MTAWLVARGYDAMLLWVLETNPTRGFYERFGGVACREQVEEFGQVPPKEIGYGWKDFQKIIDRQA